MRCVVLHDLNTGGVIVFDKIGNVENIVTKLERVKSPARTVVGWKVWYSDGGVYDSTRYKWENLPTFGVQMLKKFFSFEDGHFGVEIQSGVDAYIYDHTKFTRANAHKMIKLGEYLLGDDYVKIRSIAARDKQDITVII